MNRKIKTWAYAILLLNIIVAGIGIAKLLFDVFTGNGNTQDGLLFQNLHLTAYSTDSFMDFFNSIQYGRKPYTVGVIYPPLINLIYAIFGMGIPDSVKAQGTLAYRTSLQGIVALVLFYVMAVLLYIIAWKDDSRFTNKEKLFLTTATFFTLPFIYAVERGNSLLWCVPLTMLFVNNYNKKEKSKRILAIVALALAASMKMYPAFFGILLVREKKWKEALTAVVVGAITMFAPFLLMEKGNRSPLLWLSNIAKTSEMFQSTGYGYKVNLSNTIGFIESEFGIHITGTNFLIIAVLLINSLLVLIKKNMPQWKCIALLALITILVPGFSYTYTIMFMLIPFFCFLGSEHDQKWDCYYLILFMLMFVLLPIKNQFGGLEAINMDAVYPLGWTTIVESVALFLMEVSIVIEELPLKNREK